jgi:dTDP-4-dehydrorhamnose reductase
MKTKIIGTGITGLVGSRIVELLKDNFEFSNVSIETGTDITKPETLVIPIEKSDAQVILHLAAKTDVDGCENDRAQGENGAAWKINVIGTQNIINAGKIKNKKIIYISTDFVFDGENPPLGGYTEKDIPNPKNWYAQTKYEGEKRITNSGLPYVIVRIAYPYRAKFALKKDFARAITEKLTNNENISALTDHIFTPTFIDDIARAISIIIEIDAQGIYHVVGSTFLTPFDAANQIAETFNLPKNLIKKTTRDVYFKGRAFRPWKLGLKNDKIKSLGVKMHEFWEGLMEVKKQLQ